ncbi:hypothetical protein [Ravibacter arvi]
MIKELKYQGTGATPPVVRGNRLYQADWLMQPNFLTFAVHPKDT